MKNDATERFIDELTSSQPQLYAYILSFVRDRTRARDILQETNLVLWRKAKEHIPSGNCFAWFCSVAKFQILAAHRDCHRERVAFNSPLFDKLAEDLSHRQEYFDERRERLQHCLEQLPERQREMIGQRYSMGLSLAQMAESMGRTPDSLATTLMRIRVALQKCIHRREAMEEHV